MLLEAGRQHARPAAAAANATPAAHTLLSISMVSNPFQWYPSAMEWIVIQSNAQDYMPITSIGGRGAQAGELRAGKR